MARRLYIERLRLRHLPAVRLAVRLGWDVVAFDRDRSVKTHKTWRGLIERGHLRLLPPQPMRGCERAAIAAADAVVDRFRDDGTLRALGRLLGGDGAPVAKRVLAEQLQSVAFMHNRLEAEAEDGGRAILVVDRLLVVRRLLRRCECAWFDLPPGVRVCATERTGRIREVLASAARTASAAARTFMKLATQALPGRRLPTRLAAPIAVAVSMPFLLKFQGPRAYDFLVGGTISAEDVLFLVEFPVAVDFVAAERARGRRVIDTSRLASLRTLRAADVRGPWMRDSARAAASILARSWRHAYLADAAAAALHAHLSWNVLLRHVDIGRYVYANKEDRQQIAANVVLRGAGVETWSYALFIGGPYQLATPASPFDDRNVHWSFLNSDRWVVNNDAMRDNLAAHPNGVGAFEVIGNIFGELIRASRSDDDRRRLRSAFGLPVDVGGRTIAVFDTSFVDLAYGATTYDDAIAMLDDLLRLVGHLDDDDRILFKPSKDASWYVDPVAPWSSPVKGKAVVDRQERLAADPHVVWLDDAADTTEVSAAADLTITHCFSSPTADVMAAGLAAVWYESGDRFAGYPLDRVPGAVRRGFDELLSVVRSIDGGSTASVELSEELRELVDPYVDGAALTRLRALLSADSAVHQRERAAREPA